MNLTVDILIIGAGGAGCRAAIAAADCGTSVLLVSKKPVGESGATSYPVAEMAGYNAGDISIPMDVQLHYNDIIEAGQEMADEKLASIVASRAPDTIRQLEEWGVKFEHENGGYYVFRSCFSHYPRTHVIKGHGEPLLRAMKDQIEHRCNITVMDTITIMGLYVKDGCCIGAYGVSGQEMVYINSKAVILASGGCGQAFERNMNPSDVTGGGYSMAYHAGADLINMEFMQIGMGFSWPVVNIFNGYIWETRPRLIDRNGGDIFEGILPENLTSDDVMHEHRKHFPFSSSDDSKYLEVAVQAAVKAGRCTEHNGIMADFSRITDDYVNSLKDDCGIHHMWPIARDYLKSRGVDLLNDKVEVACYAHAVNGGVKIDTKGMSSIQGLFAAGECAGGPHGADRLGGNMMVTCQVFGNIAGTSAAEYALRRHHAEHLEQFGDIHMEKMKTLLYKKVDIERIMKTLRRCTQNNLLVARTEGGLTELLNVAQTLAEELECADSCDKPCPGNIDAYHMLTTVRIMAQCALMRKESRGSHHRADYPFKDEKYNKPVIIRKNGEMPF